MTQEEIKTLEKTVSKAKFKMSQAASELHDLIEDRLLSDFEDIPSFAERTYKSAVEWNLLRQQLEEANLSTKR